jgi:hypothetical protein
MVKLNLVEYCKENNLSLVDEWHEDNDKKPYEISYGSAYMAIWKILKKLKKAA